MALGFAQGIGWVATSAQEEAWCDSLIISGCTLTLAQNYNPAATFDDGSCQLPGCMDTLAWNFNRYANFPDASCIGVDSVGSVLKATAGWEEDGNGTDDLGFGGLPGGATGAMVLAISTTRGSTVIGGAPQWRAVPFGTAVYLPASPPSGGTKVYPGSAFPSALCRTPSDCNKAVLNF
ncbi:hypothetical protein OAG26_01970 [Flavobacteriales bacterium]|nr:hypothetical protein [Flavobacteriales bacterium]